MVFHKHNIFGTAGTSVSTDSALFIPNVRRTCVKVWNVCAKMCKFLVIFARV